MTETPKRRTPSLLGRRRALVCIVAVAVTAASAGLAASAIATIFDPGEHVGTFKVLGGHIRQKVDYFDDYKITPQAQRYCWTYLNKDKGSGRFEVSFDEGETSMLTYAGGTVEFDKALRVSGTTTRHWNTDVKNLRGPRAGEDDCEPADPPHTNAVCGSKKVKDAKSAVYLALAGKNRVNYTGRSVALEGGLLRKDPLEQCPSDSFYGVVMLPAAVSQGGAAKLDDAKVGSKVKLAGDQSLTGRGSDGFGVMGEFVSGSQTAQVDWSLNLKRVKKRG